MIPDPPRLFARPLLGDLLRALGLAVLAGGVLGMPFWLPTRWRWWVMLVLAFLAVWLIAFLSLRTWRQTRRP
jgi:hypothetical protein